MSLVMFPNPYRLPAIAAPLPIAFNAVFPGAVNPFYAAF
jgi:hypothetical protein